MELGAPDVRTVRKAAGKSEHVLVLAYDEARTKPWWESVKGELSKIDKLTVIFIPDPEADALAAMAARSMKFAVTIQDSVIWINSDTADVQINPEYLKRETQRWT